MPLARALAITSRAARSPIPTKPIAHACSRFSTRHLPPRLSASSDTETTTSWRAVSMHNRSCETYSAIIRWLGDDDPTTRKLMEDILKVEEEHADDLANLLTGFKVAGPDGL